MGSTPLLKVNQACDDSVLWATQRLEKAGYQAVRTFDLQVAKRLHFDCPCPHHGMEKCDCWLPLLACPGKQPHTKRDNPNHDNNTTHTIHYPSTRADHLA